MHTYTATDGTVFIFNPDLSDVRINVPEEDIEDIDYDTVPMCRVTVPGPAMQEFIVAYLRDAIVDELQNFDLNQLFNGMFR